MGAELVRGNVVRVGGAAGEFLLNGADGEPWQARTPLLATGVARYNPTVAGDFTPCLAYAGKGTMLAPETKPRAATFAAVVSPRREV
jgi:thioredoxin reductase